MRDGVKDLRESGDGENEREIERVWNWNKEHIINEENKICVIIWRCALNLLPMLSLTWAEAVFLPQPLCQVGHVLYSALAVSKMLRNL